MSVNSVFTDHKDVKMETKKPVDETFNTDMAKFLTVRKGIDDKIGFVSKKIAFLEGLIKDNPVDCPIARNMNTYRDRYGHDYYKSITVPTRLMQPIVDDLKAELSALRAEKNRKVEAAWNELRDKH